jgi:hypothetical protein
MIDRFLSSTYDKSRRELAMDKLAQQLSNLPSGDLASMAQSGAGAMSNQSPQLPPTAQATGQSPTTGPRMPPQQQIQGTGLGGQAAMAGETGMKMAAAKMRMAAAVLQEKRAFSLAGAGQALKGVNWGQLARQNAVPLATGAAGAAAGAYMGGRDGGGLSGALGGAALGGLGGAAVGKGGQLAYRAAAKPGAGGAGGFAQRLKGEVNAEAQRTQRAIGVEGKVWRPFGGKPAAPVAGAPVDAAGVVPPTPATQPAAPVAPPQPAVKPPAPRQQAAGAVEAPAPGARPKKMSAKQRRQQAMSEAGIAQPTSGLPG